MSHLATHVYHQIYAKEITTHLNSHPVLYITFTMYNALEHASPICTSHLRCTTHLNSHRRFVCFLRTGTRAIVRCAINCRFASLHLYNVVYAQHSCTHTAVLFHSIKFTMLCTHTLVHTPPYCFTPSSSRCCVRTLLYTHRRIVSLHQVHDVVYAHSCTRTAVLFHSIKFTMLCTHTLVHTPPYCFTPSSLRCCVRTTLLYTHRRIVSLHQVYDVVYAQHSCTRTAVLFKRTRNSYVRATQ